MSGFAGIVAAEWVKLRTVRGWVLALAAVAVLTVAVSADLAVIARDGNTPPAVATGPGGEAVTDSFYFVHQPLTGDGSITVRVRSLAAATPGAVQPWAKAGVIMQAGTAPGAPYAAVLVTGGHGVRMQDDYTGDVAGARRARAPWWLRLSRTGEWLTGYDSADGRHWTRIGTARLAGLPATVQAGLFVASPLDAVIRGTDSVDYVRTGARATFGRLGRLGRWPGGRWAGTAVGPGELAAIASGPPLAGGFRAACCEVTVTGSGDIAPYVPAADPLQASLYGSLAGLLAVIALGALFITAEYRRNLIRTTLAASPRRGLVLAAKALVLGAAAFLAGLAGTAAALPIAVRRLADNGWQPPYYQLPALASGTGLRIVAGTAALLAVAAILALAAGTLLLHPAGVITATAGLVVFPLALAFVLPPGPADWLLRVTPAAAFGLQRALPSYPQAPGPCLAYQGCFPLGPWAGLGVAGAWAAVALGAALLALRYRDA